MKFPFYILCLFPFSGCKSPSDQILEAFKTVDSSLVRSNREVAAKNSYTFYYLSIIGKDAKNKDWLQKADSLYQAMLNIITLIERTQTNLKEKDPVGDNQLIAAHWSILSWNALRPQP